MPLDNFNGISIKRIICQPFLATVYWFRSIRMNFWFLFHSPLKSQSDSDSMIIILGISLESTEKTESHDKFFSIIWGFLMVVGHSVWKISLLEAFLLNIRVPHSDSRKDFLNARPIRSKARIKNVCAFFAIYAKHHHKKNNLRYAF